jgi:hypothetical protein
LIIRKTLQKTISWQRLWTCWEKISAPVHQKMIIRNKMMETLNFENIEEIKKELFDELRVGERSTELFM